jgi:hypothetical protein
MFILYFYGPRFSWVFIAPSPLLEAFYYGGDFKPWRVAAMLLYRFDSIDKKLFLKII